MQAILPLNDYRTWSFYALERLVLSQNFYSEHTSASMQRNWSQNFEIPNIKKLNDVGLIWMGEAWKRWNLAWNSQ